MPKITEYPAATVLTDDGLLVMVESPGGTPITKKITALNAKTYLGGGATILVGAVPPTAGDGAVGDFYVDTAGDDLYGPKSAGGFGAEQRLTIPNDPNNDTSTSNLGVRVTFTRAGRVTRLRYKRQASSPATLNFRVWNSGGTQVGSTVSASDVGTGAFEVSLASPLTIAAGSTYTFAVGSPSLVPRNGTAAYTPTNTTDCTFVGFFSNGVGETFFPNTALVGASAYVEPVYQPDAAPWPLALETPTVTAAAAGVLDDTTTTAMLATLGTAHIAVKSTTPVAADYGLAAIPTGALWVQSP